MMNMNKTTITIVALGVCALLAGCASTPEPAQDGTNNHGTIEQRAAERWALIADKNWYAAYEYLSPGTRAALSAKAYAQNMSAATINWLRGEVKDASACEDATVCDVTVQVYYRVTGGVTGVRKPIELNRPISESWIQIDDAWYFVPDSLR